MSRIATLMVHTSPLDQAGVGDAGGMNIYVKEVSERLAELGCQVDIYTRRTNKDAEPITEVEPGVRVIQLNVGDIYGVKKEALPGLIPALIEEFENQVQGKGYDIIHSHYWISGKVAEPVAKKLGIPWVHTMHTMARVKNLSLAEGEAPEPMVRVQGETQIVAAADALIANTDAEAASLVSLYDACPDDVFVVPPGVNLKRFTVGEGRMDARDYLGLPRDGHVVAFIGRIQPHKGPEILIRAIDEMLKHSPNLKQKLYVAIVGGASGGTLSEVERLKDLVKWFGLSHIIRFIPPVPRSSLPQWYRAADLVCVPSYSESFGLVALEAQACGTPVVASAVGGLRTAVADGISGVLVDGHDPKAWSSVIARLLQSPDRCAELARGAVEHASHFGWEKTAAGIHEIFHRLQNVAHEAVHGA